MKLVSIGDIAVDFYQNLNIKKLGGIAFNFAFNFANDGLEISLVSRIGDDLEGEKILNILTSKKMDTTHTKKVKGQTAIQNILIKENGEKEFKGYKANVLLEFSLSKKDLDFISERDAVFVPLNDGMEKVFLQIYSLEKPKFKIVDFSKDSQFGDFTKDDNPITKYSDKFDLVFVGGSRDEVKLLRNLSRQNPTKIYVLTLGSQGSIAFMGNVEYKQEPFKVKKVVDTTGCGDAFEAGFVSSYLKYKDIEKALDYAAYKASLTAMNLGSTGISLN